MLLLSKTSLQWYILSSRLKLWGHPSHSMNSLMVVSKSSTGSPFTTGCLVQQTFNQVPLMELYQILRSKRPSGWHVSSASKSKLGPNLFHQKVLSTMFFSYTEPSLGSGLIVQVQFYANTSFERFPLPTVNMRNNLLLADYN